ncbi:unnamed protein product [Ectocarpus sp. 12 AP-2014]
MGGGWLCCCFLRECASGTVKEVLCSRKLRCTCIYRGLLCASRVSAKTSWKISAKYSCVYLRTGDGVCSLRCGHPLKNSCCSGLNFQGTLPSREDERLWYSSVRRRSNIHDTLPSREGEEYPWYPSGPRR